MHSTDDGLSTAVDEPPDSNKVLGLYKARDRNLHLDRVVPGVGIYSVPDLPSSLSASSGTSSPNFPTSPTESTFGSPSSLSSVNSSLPHGENADLDDFEFEYDLDRASETGELSSDALAALDLSSDTTSDKDDVTEQDEPTQVTPRGVVTRHGLRSNADSTPMKHNRGALSSKRGHWPLRKGRVFELIADGDDLPRTTSPPSRKSSDNHSCELDREMPMAPPMQSPSVIPQDTVPLVPSPLCNCITSDHAECTRDQRAGSSEDDTLSTGSTVADGSQLVSECQSRSKTPVDRSRHRTSSALRRVGASASTPALKSSLSSKEEGRGRRRSRSSVRFSSAAPVEVRTHSPVDYDRKACPVSNKLCDKDLKELRDLSLPLDLLESRCSALRGSAVDKTDAEAPSEVQSKPSSQQRDTPVPTVVPASLEEAQTSPGTRGGPTSLPPTPSHRMDPHKDLRKLQEQRKNAARSSPHRAKPERSSSTSALGSMLAARFGLNTPPPPLPGTNASCPPSNASTDSLASLPEESPQTSLAHSHDPMCGYESPATELHDSGSEYDLYV